MHCRYDLMLESSCADRRPPCPAFGACHACVCLVQVMQIAMLVMIAKAVERASGRRYSLHCKQSGQTPQLQATHRDMQKWSFTVDSFPDPSTLELVEPGSEVAQSRWLPVLFGVEMFRSRV